MPIPSKWHALLALLVVVVGSGCAMVHAPGKSPLSGPQMSPDSVVLDIFFVRFPFGQEEANNRLWDEIDEQHLPPEVRRQLTKCGFRAGVISGQIPVTLSQLLDTSDRPPPDAGEVQKINFAEMESDPRVIWRHLQCRPGRRSEVLASEVYDSLPILTNEPSGLSGDEYKKAQGVLAVKTFPEPDGRVRVEVVPELHYGDPRARFVGDQGVLRMESGRARRVFDQLTLSATLAPGHLLALSSIPTRPGSVGHYFFTTTTAGQREQKLLVIRLSQTQHDGLFDPAEALPLDASTLLDAK